MKEFEFKGQMYDLHKLILLNKDSSVKEYSDGIVKNIKTNKTYDINELLSYYHEEIAKLLNDNILDEKAQNALTKLCKARLQEICNAEIFTKLEDNTVTLMDIEYFLNEFNRKDRSKFGMLHFNSFQIFNSEAEKPKELSKTDYGGFMMLATRIDHYNRLAYSNGKPFSKEELMAILEFNKLNTLYGYLEKLAKFNLIKKIKINKIKFIYINPLYTYKFYRVDKIAYNLFTEDIKGFLTALESKYLELLFLSFEKNNEIIKL